MRIISQNGDIDYLYDNISLTIDGGCIVANYQGTSICVAIYSHHEIAVMVMDMLHTRYNRMDMSVWQFPAEEEL